MGSSDGGGGGNPGLLSQFAGKLGNLPVAGEEGTARDPYDYGKYQSFLPNISAEGPNPMATGLRPSMFEYRSPKEILAGNGTEGGGEGGGGTTLGGDTGKQTEDLRGELAKLTAARPAAGAGPIGGRIPGLQEYLDMMNSLPATDRGGGG